jgi:hypothetical protein
MTAIASRLKRLEGNRRGDCPVCKSGSLIRYRVKGRDDLDPPPPNCRACGRPIRVVNIVEVVVTTRAEAVAALAAMKKE